MTEISSASILRISDDKTLQLIDLYYKEDCLWDTSTKHYKDKVKRSLAAEKIATILDLPNFTAKHVMMKFKNLRNSYSQELKKISHSLLTVAQDEDVYVPKVFWFNKLDSFIRPHLQGKTPKDQSLMYKLDDATDEWMQVDNAEQVLNPDSTLTTKPHSESEEELSNSAKKRKLCKYPKKTKADTKEESISQSLKDIQSHLHVLMSRNDDYHDSFGKYVASLLRSLPSQTAFALQSKIVNLITETGLQSSDAEHPQTAECQSTHDAVVKFDCDGSE